jgi:hypothetical protein
MNLHDFFKQLDNATQQTATQQAQKENLYMANVQIVSHYAQRLDGLLQAYITEFKHRGYQCTTQHQAPYYSLQVSKACQNNIEISIVSTPNTYTGFEIAFFYNSTRKIIVGTPHINNGFDKPEVEAFLHKAFGYLI